MPKARHFAPPLLVLFLGCTILSGGAQAGWFDFGSDKAAAKPAQPDAKEKALPVSPAANLEDSIHQAQMLRLAGNYQEAVKHLSQLMMVAADDPRVVGEYGKSLAQMGRASDAVNFLTRASQLSPGDWSVYSALGVAYDQIGNQKAAQAAYEHALVLKPGEPSVLNNYALSRLLAKDTDMARSLAGRAEIANAAGKDDEITRNIAMIRSVAPAPSVAVNKPAPQAMPASFTPVAQQALPHPLPVQKVTQAPLPVAATPDNRVVMQRVPVDPLAGPVANHAPRPLQPVAKAEAPKVEASKTETPKPETAKAEPAKPVSKPEVAKALAAKPSESKVEVAAKLAAKPDVAAKTDSAKPVVKIDLAAAKPAAKAESKAPEPKVLAPLPVKAVSVRPAPAKTDTKTDSKADGKAPIPGLRLSANAF